MLTTKPDDLFVPTRHLLFFRFPRHFMHASGYQFIPTHQFPDPLWFRWYPVPLSVPQAQISHPTFSLPASQSIVFLAFFFFAPFGANSIQPVVSSRPACFNQMLFNALIATTAPAMPAAPEASNTAEPAKRRLFFCAMETRTLPAVSALPVQVWCLPKLPVNWTNNHNTLAARNVIHLAIVVLATVDSPCLGDKRAGIFTLRHDGTFLPDCLEGGSVFKHLPLSLFILICRFRSTHNLSRSQPRSYSMTCCSSCDTNSATSPAVTPGLASR